MLGGEVLSVQSGSPAARAGIVPGDVVSDVDGEALTDILVWRWASADESVSLTVVGGDGTTRSAELERRPDESFGIEFEDVIFDGVRTCSNACRFCFVKQLPPGLRPSLYVRDDDYRLSFLGGNFITLTNMAEADLARIEGMRLSPLYVSLHATNPAVREELLCPREEDRALEVLDRVGAAGIELHAQIVLVPGVNDGSVLHETLRWLAQREYVLSVGVVPVGRTRHQKWLERSYESAAEAGPVVADIEGWQARMVAARGVRWVYAADELYLVAGLAIPRTKAYDDFPQYENGIGIARSFLDSAEQSMAEVASLMTARVHGEVDRTSRAERVLQGRITLVTGELAAPVVEEGLVAHLCAAGVDARVLPVPNSLLGGNVSVAGLLAGADVAKAIRADGASGIYLVPEVVQNDDGLMIDDVPAASLAELTGADVRLVSSDAVGLADALVRPVEGDGARL